MNNHQHNGEWALQNCLAEKAFEELLLIMLM